MHALEELYSLGVFDVSKDDGGRLILKQKDNNNNKSSKIESFSLPHDHLPLSKEGEMMVEFGMVSGSSGSWGAKIAKMLINSSKREFLYLFLFFTFFKLFFFFINIK
jgi:hypothetical protein